jgi:hypothetical protein
MSKENKLNLYEISFLLNILHEFYMNEYRSLRD